MSIYCTHIFTEREKQILELIAKGFTSVAISKILIISSEQLKHIEKILSGKPRRVVYNLIQCWWGNTNDRLIKYTAIGAASRVSTNCL